MTRILLLPFLCVLAACAEEAGKSTYFDSVNPPPVSAYDAQRQSANQKAAQEIQSRNAEILRNNDPLIVQTAPGSNDPLITRVEGTDAALTSTLSQAITEAENGTIAGVQPQTPVSGTQTAGVQTTSQTPLVGNNAPDPNVSLTNEAGITDNSFGRIKRRDSIETDAERLAAAQSELVVIEPEALPQRESANVAAFAMATTHKPGQRVYRRGAGSRSERASGCGRYRSKDDAQRAFLAAGGPNRDRLGLDPDGDGFVCGWSPLPYRSLQLPSSG